MKPSEKLAAPRAPGSAETSFQTGSQTAEGLQLPKTWVTWTLGQLEKRKEWARELREKRSEEKEGQRPGAGAVRGREAGCWAKAVGQSGEMERPPDQPPLDFGDRPVPCFEPQAVTGYLPTLLTPDVETPLSFIIKVPSWQTAAVNEAGHLGASKQSLHWTFDSGFKMLLSFFQTVRQSAPPLKMFLFYPISALLHFLYFSTMIGDGTDSDKNK